MIRKILIVSVALITMSFMLTGCGNQNVSNTKNKQTNAIDKVLQQGVNNQSSKEEDATRNPKLYVKDDRYDGKVDIDTTTMNSSMVYSTVYQMMINPKDYEGKVISVVGNYYSVWFEPTQQYYHYVVIQDATACCSSGFEFIWDDDSHVYPDEYPLEEDEVYITGVFETYTENGDLYCRLNNATLYMTK